MTFEQEPIEHKHLWDNKEKREWSDNELVVTRWTQCVICGQVYI